jgi:transposase-like protein/phage FluMu protein Com
MPTIQVLEKLDYQKLILEHLNATGKPLKSVSHRKPNNVPATLVCPRCNAPHDYLYDNTGGRGQYLCKVCNCNFNSKNHYLKNVVYRCPHCGKILIEAKKRKDFLIHKCNNPKCPYYLNKLSSMSAEEKAEFKTNPHDFKVHYIFREFNFDFVPLANKSGPVPNVDLSKIYASPHLLGLVLSYHVNFCKSARETAAILREIHGVNISHQTVINYSNAVARVVKPFIDNFKYNLSDSICGDETYIKVLGKWHYVFFIFDAVKKIILAYPVSPERDTFSAIKAIDEALSKFQSIPDHLTLIFDGNPIYLLAQHYFAQHGIFFDVKQVIGLSNDDPVSQEYRPLKQIG